MALRAEGLSRMRLYSALAFLPPIIGPSAKGSHDCDDWTETVDCRALQVSRVSLILSMSLLS